jgi:hypothetical protein
MVHWYHEQSLKPTVVFGSTGEIVPPAKAPYYADVAADYITLLWETTLRGNEIRLWIQTTYKIPDTLSGLRTYRRMISYAKKVYPIK